MRKEVAIMFIMRRTQNVMIFVTEWLIEEKGKFVI